MSKPNVPIYVNPETLQRVQGYARLHGLSLSSVGRQSIMARLRGCPPYAGPLSGRDARVRIETPHELHAIVTRLAAAEGVSASEWVVRAVLGWLDAWGSVVELAAREKAAWLATQAPASAEG